MAGLVSLSAVSVDLGEEPISNGRQLEDEDETWHPPRLDAVHLIESGPALIFGERPEGYFRIRRRPRVDVPGQGSLFDCG
jgi:hypothetical protein